MQKEIVNSVNDILVSAVVTTYNRPEMARRAIKSVLNQTYNNMEIIVVEDGSDSGIEKWLEDNNLLTVRYIRHEKNKGLAAARNTGIRLAKGKFIGFLDDDDEWKPQRIEKQVELFDSLSIEEKENLGVIYCGTETHSPDKTIISISYPKNKGNLREAIISEGASTPSSSFLFSKKALEAIDGFDENLPSSIDHDIWMGLASHDYFAYTIDEALVIVHDRDGRHTMMSDTDRRIHGVKAFTEKWIPTFKNWFGPQEGIKYGERYFSKVISSLVLVKIKEGSFKEAIKAVKAIFSFNSQKRYNFIVMIDILKKIVKYYLQRLLPENSYNQLKSIWNRTSASNINIV